MGVTLPNAKRADLKSELPERKKRRILIVPKFASIWSQEALASLLSTTPETVYSGGERVHSGPSQSNHCPTANDLMPVKMQLARIIISELTENQVIYLQEVDGGYGDGTARLSDGHHCARPLS